MTDVLIFQQLVNGGGYIDARTRKPVLCSKLATRISRFDFRLLPSSGSDVVLVRGIAGINLQRHPVLCENRMDRLDRAAEEAANLMPNKPEIIIISKLGG